MEMPGKSLEARTMERSSGGSWTQTPGLIPTEMAASKNKRGSFCCSGTLGTKLNTSLGAGSLPVLNQMHDSSRGRRRAIR